jgi:hypothetical protein
VASETDNSSGGELTSEPDSNGIERKPVKRSGSRCDNAAWKRGNNQTELNLLQQRPEERRRQHYGGSNERRRRLALPHHSSLP